MQEQKKYNLADGNIRKRFVSYKYAGYLYSLHISDVIFRTLKSELIVQEFQYLFMRTLGYIFKSL